MNKNPYTKFFHISNRYFLYLFLGFLTIISILPFYTMLINATRDTVSIGQGVSLLPGKHLLENYHNALSKVNLVQGLWNSIQITVPAVFTFCIFWYNGIFWIGRIWRL